MENKKMIAAPKPRKLLHEPQHSPSGLRKKIVSLLRKDGNPEDYVSLYHEIPDFMKNMRNEFVYMIYQKARQKDWLTSKLGSIMKEIG